MFTKLASLLENEAPASVVVEESIPIVDTSEAVATPEIKIEDDAVVEKLVVVEDKLASRFSALSRKEKELHNRQKDIESKLKDFESKSNGLISSEQLTERLKNNPLSLLQEHGIDFTKLAELAVKNGLPEEIDPVAAKFKELESKIQEANDKVLRIEKEKESLEYNSRLADFQSHVKGALEKYPIAAINLTVDDIMETIDNHYKTTQEVLEVDKLCASFETEYEAKLEQMLKLDKIKSRFFVPPPVVEASKQPSNKDQKANESVTLSNKAGSSVAPAQNPELSYSDSLRLAKEMLTQKFKR